MGWTVSNARLRRELLARDPSDSEAADASAVVYREGPFCLSTPNYSECALSRIATVPAGARDSVCTRCALGVLSARATGIDLSALIRRLGAAIGEPSAKVIVAAIMSSLPPLDLGSDESPMHVLLGLDWPGAHTPMRANVNRARARPALVSANRLTAVDIGPETPVNFASIMATPALKRHFFGLCAGTLRDRLCRLPVRNAVMTFLSCDGGVHTAAYDAAGAMAYSYSERKSGYGEADIEIPLYMRLLAPSGQWEYHVRTPPSARPPNSRANEPLRVRTRANESQSIVRPNPFKLARELVPSERAR